MQIVLVRNTNYWLMLICALVFPTGSAAAQSCSVTGTTGNYGVVDVLAAVAVDATSNFQIGCTGTPNQTVRMCVELSPGQVNAAGNRRLAAGSYRLVHELYSDPARTNVWGSWGLSTTAYGLHPIGIQYDIPLDAFGNGSATLTIYGRIAGSQTTAGSGSYIWTSATSPAAQYDYATPASCPTGTRQATSSGSIWTATVNASCNVSATNLNFGAVGVLAQNVDALGQVNVACTSGTPYRTALSYGVGAGAGIGAQRYMTGPGGVAVSYNLYKDSARTNIWGDSLGVNTVDATGTGATQNHTVFGRVPPQTTPTAGLYSDSVVVTVNY